MDIKEFLYEAFFKNFYGTIIDNKEIVILVIIAIMIITIIFSKTKKPKNNSRR